MRTTLTLDEDVAKVLARLRDERGLPLKTLVNEALRRGLDELDAPQPPPRRPPTSPAALRPVLPDVDDVAGTLALAEGDGRR